MSWSAGLGSPFAGPGATQSAAAAGLPFAGIPSELADKAKKILAEEPVHPEPVVVFSQIPPDSRAFTLRRFLAPHRWGLVAAFGLVVLETIALQAGPWLTKAGIDNGVGRKDFTVLLGVTVFYLVAVVINIVAGATRVSYTGRLGERLTYELRLRVFAHLQRLGLDYYTEERQGRLLTRMTSDIDALSVLFQDGLVNLVVQGLTLVLVAGILLTLDIRLALITLLAVVPAMAVLTWWFRAASDQAYNRVRDRIADVLSDLSENLSGVRVVSATNRRRNNLILHTNLVGEHRDANVDAARIGAIYGPVSEGVGALGQAALLAVGGVLIQRDQLTVGELIAFLLYLTSFFAPIQQLVALYTTYQSGRAAVVKLADLLATVPSTPEKVDAVALPTVSGHIRLEGVTFGYDPDRPILRNVSLEVFPGEVLAVVGPTGAGKSTVAKLVTRFYDPQGGRVLLDGYDLRDVTIESLRRQLGVVPQEPFLFGGSFRSNVSFARPDAPDEELLEACREVGLADLVARLPEGLDTIIHERGVSLSAGERQLLALARALVARPRVLVLDEATSNLDLASERKVELALDRVLGGGPSGRLTTIIIAHRLATARRADRIAVIEAGQVVEIGTHRELLACEGRYAALFSVWAAHAGEDT